MKAQWVRIDTAIGGHPRTLAVNKKHYIGAVGLHILGICYASQHRTYGKIPKEALRYLAKGNQNSVNAIVAELIRVGLWSEEGDGYEIHDYAQWQECSASETAASERGQKAAHARWGHRNSVVSDAECNASCNASCNADENASALPREEKRREEKSTGEHSHDDVYDDVPASVQLKWNLARTWERVVGVVPSQGDLAKITAWAQMGYSESAVEEALVKAVESGAGGKAAYATRILATAPEQKKKSVLPEEW